MTKPTTSCDAVVIGAGVIGSAVALELTRRGLEVTCVDKLPAPGYGSTSASSAVVRFNYSTRAGVAMSYEGYHYWTDWSGHIGDVGDMALAEYIRAPMLVPKMAADDHRAVVDHFEQLGVSYEDLSLEEATARWPYLDLRVFGPPATLDDQDAAFWGEPDVMHHGVISMTDAGYINDPQLAAANLASAASAAGTNFRFNSEVVSIDRRLHASSGRPRVAGVTLADGERLRSPVVVNVAGPHARKICAMADVLDTMNRSSRALRREVYIVPAPKGVDYDRTGVTIGDNDVGVYFRPERGNNILIGNAEPDCDELVWVDDPDGPVGTENTISQEGFELHALRVARRIRGVPIPGVKRGLASMYDATPDWIPIYDRSDLDGFYLAIGTSGNQFKNAAVAGHAMAELILAVEGGHDHDDEPLVVTGTYTGFDIDMGTFTRNRVVPEDSDMNVFG